MRMSCSEGGGDRRLRPCRLGATIVVSAFAATLLLSSLCEAADCLASAEEVRKVTPKAWPKWTYGPNGERCWYSGQKPVFAKAARAQAAAPAAPVPRATTATATTFEERSAEPVRRPWALEYRWSDRFEIRHKAREEEPLTSWIGNADEHEAGRLAHPSQ
jgi:hypothetical protein